jgi:predicted type IV restriction endonuclease
MAVYQDKALARIKDKLRTTAGVINRAKKANTKEADTRTIVFDILTDMLGWDRYENITAEYAIKGGYADYAIQKKDSKGNQRIYAVVEIKPIVQKLNENHYRQARDYAINEGVPWVFLTNGNDWQVYRIEINKRKNPPIPEVFQCFSVTINDTEKRPADRVEWLYFMTEEASRKDELEKLHQKLKAISPENLVRRLLSKEVIDRVRLDVKKDIGINFSNNEIAELLLDTVIRDDVKPDNCSYYIKKLCK